MNNKLWIKGVHKSVESVESELSGEMPAKVKKRVMTLLKTYYVGGGGGHDRAAVSVAASAEYAARLLENKKKDQQELAEVYGVGKQTIREVYQEILEPNVRSDLAELGGLECANCGYSGLYPAFAHPQVQTSGVKQNMGYLKYTNLICYECGEVQSGEQNVWEYEH